MPTDGPRIAGVYNRYLHAASNFGPDRDLADRVLEVFPRAATFARENRAFLRRGVRYLLELGVSQFVDLGCGGPDVGSVHEVAQKFDPRIPVVQVDSDDIVLQQRILANEGNPYTLAIHGDVTRPNELFDNIRKTRHVDVTRPVGVVAGALFHFVSDKADPQRIVAALRAHVGNGSYLLLTHATHDQQGEDIDAVLEEYRKDGLKAYLRDRDQIADIASQFGNPIPPGVVFLPDWKPEDTADDGALTGLRAAESASYGVVCRRSGRPPTI